VLATWFIRQFFLDFRQKFPSADFSFSPKVGSVYTSKKTHEDHLKGILASMPITSSKTQIDVHILNIDKYYSPLFVYFLTCKDVGQFRYVARE
jgi:hypothetical protein